ncbi:MAG: polyisoprenoid-binding protein, partial [Chloroflexi bacterium]|nr:polyisoprenoid-binding protein [Chloroflexota bacterium]
MSWTIDNSHTSAEFSVRHLMVTTVKGRFTKVSGTGEFDEADPSNSWVQATLESESINTGDEKRDGHLRTADFFEVEKYPLITFKSSRVEKISNEEYKIIGDLTIRDVTKEVTLAAEYAGQVKSPFGDIRAGFSAHTSISRKDFGLSWNVALETGGVM